MSSDDAFFWAGMAGGRMDRINRINAVAREWREHAEHLERVVNELSAENRALRSSRLVWLDNAVDQGAQARLLSRIFKETQGQTAREYLGGDDPTEKAIEEARVEERKNGIGKNFDWDL